MRFLGVGDYCDLGALYLRLQAEGHDVKVFISDPLCHDVLSGMITRIADWRAELSWVKAAGEDGVIVFENVAEQRGAVQDDLRAQGFNVIGGSAFGDRLETDRAYGQRVLAELGLNVAPVHEFTEYDSAARHIDKHPGRYVLKFNNPEFEAADNYVALRVEGRTAMRRMTMREAEQALSPHGFVRIHRRFLVNSSRVAELRGNGKPFVRLTDGTELPVGQAFRDNLRPSG